MKKNTAVSRKLSLHSVILFLILAFSCVMLAIGCSEGSQTTNNVALGAHADALTEEEAQTAPTEAKMYDGTSFRPHVLPDGKAAGVVSSYSFSEDGYGFVYNYDWAQYTYALDYGTYTEGENTMYRLRTLGGGYQPRLYAYAANGDDISTAGWVSMYVDMRGLADTSDNAVGIRLYLSSQPTLDDQASSSSAPLFLREGAVGYYYSTDGNKWQSAAVSEKTIDVGADFAGYVCFPLASFEHVKEDGRKHVTDAFTAQDLFSAGYSYLCRVWTFCDIADTHESHTQILFDDLMLLRSGDSHQHSYVYSDTVSATCTEGGYEVYECSDCSQLEQRNPTLPKGHSQASPVSNGERSWYPCELCEHVEPSTQKGSAVSDNVYTVTFVDRSRGSVTSRLYREGDVIEYSDIPAGGVFTDRYTYQFNAWTEDSELIRPRDPLGVRVTEDMTFYARYLISSYADKYIGAVSVLAQNGGPYVIDEGRVVVLGNSNMSLYHGLEASFASSGIPVYNNSVSGSTSYEMIEWFRVLVASYRPSAVVLNVTTNDMAYYNLSERQILENMMTLYSLSREFIPDTQVFFVSGNPLPGRTEYTESIVRTNNAVARFSCAAEKCEFVDVYARVLAIAEKYPTGWDTWTHMNQQNLKLMFDDIKSAILAALP